MRSSGLAGAAAVIAILLSACAKTTRDNVFVPPVFGESPVGGGPPPTGSAWTAPGAWPAATAPASTVIRPQPQRSGLAAPIVRDPGQAEAAVLALRDPIRASPDGTVTMSFERIAVPDFVRAVFGELLGLNYAVTPGLAGAVSLQVSQPVPRQAVFQIAEAALESVGALVRRDGDLVLVEADTGGTSRPGRPGAVTVRRLAHVDAAEVQRALEPFTSRDAAVTPGPVAGTLLLSGTPDGVGALDGLVTALDIDPLSNKHFGLFPLKRANSARVAVELRDVLGAGGDRGPRVVNVERLNAVLVVADARKAISEAGFWTSKLDLGDASGNQVFVYPVQNRRAGELAALLKDAFGLGDAATAAPLGVAPGLTMARAEGAGFAEPDVSAFRDVASYDGLTNGLNIFADEGTNSVVTIATTEQYATIEATLRQMDVQPVQVLIEATIIEVSLNDELRYGVRWFFESGDVSVGFTDLADGAVSAVFPGFNFVLDSGDVRAVISALDKVSDVQVVSAPSLMVLNNETARLQVGDEVPIATQQAVNVITPDAPIVNSITQRQTGIVLEITPRVNASGLVLLDVVQEVSSAVQTDSSDINSPTIANRQIRSSVALRDRETLALGGLITTTRSRGRSGIPILADIPVVGALFGSTEQRADRTELLIVIRPIVVRSHAEARLAYQDLRAKLRGLDDLSQYLPPN